MEDDYRHPLEMPGLRTRTTLTGEDAPCDGSARDLLGVPSVIPAVSVSSMEDFFACHRLFMFKHRFRLTQDRWERAPSRGRMFHAAMRAYYDGLDTAAAHRLASQELEGLAGRLEDEVESGRQADAVESILAQAEKDLAVATIMAQVYWETYPLDRNIWTVLAGEALYETVLGNVSLKGYTDRLLYHKELEGIFIVDFKTTDRDPKQHFATLDFNGQGQMYRVLVELNGRQVAAGGVPVLGFVLNVVRTCNIRQKQARGKKPAQTFEDYLAELREWYAGEGRWSKNRDKWIDSPPMQQFVTHFPRPLMTEEFRNIVHLVGKASRAVPDPDVFGRTGWFRGNCINRYNRVCPMLPLCQANQAYWRGIVSRQFTIRPPRDQGDSNETTTEQGTD